MNYALHNKELHGTLLKPEAPVIFTKADSALLKDHKPFFVPDHLGRIDYETELVVRICRLGKNIPVRFAHRYYDAVTVGIDFTAREMQTRLREKGLPWEFRDVQALRFHLDINGARVQEGCACDMLFKIDEIISYISQFFTLKTGDLLYTGTPAGVGPVNIGDHMEGYIEDRKVLEFNCK